MSELLGSLYALPDALFAGAVPLGDVPVPANVADEEPKEEDQVTSAALEELSRATLESGATCLTCGLGVPGLWPASLHGHCACVTRVQCNMFCLARPCQVL